MNLSNAHCHPQFLDSTSRTSILNSWIGNPVIASSTHFEDALTVLTLSEKHPHVLPTIGWHPWYIKPSMDNREIDFIMSQFKSLLLLNDVPIGEIGLDWHPKWKHTRKLQIEILERFFMIANELERPVVIHCVRAHHEVLRLLKQHPKTKVYLHHYQGNPTASAQYLRYNTYFGLPILQWSNHGNELIINIPNERLLVESDECVSSEEFTVLTKKIDLTDQLLMRCRNNLFQFIQGTSGDFIQHFHFACES